MAHGAALGLTITRLTRLIRQRRALFYGVRGLAWGLCLAVVPVALPRHGRAVGAAGGGRARRRRRRWWASCTGCSCGCLRWTRSAWPTARST